MIDQLPWHIPSLFILVTLMSLAFLYRLLRSARLPAGQISTILLMAVLWLTGHALLAYNGFYLETIGRTPPGFFLAIGPLIILTIFLFAIRGTRQVLSTFSLKELTWLSIVRIPVEIVLYWLAAEAVIPELMSFGGRNFDILAGLTAPLIAYLAFKGDTVNRKLLLVWNLVGLVLLLNIIIHAVLSTPSTFQQFAFDQPNIGLLHFPFIWLACFVAPFVLFSHIVMIWRLTKSSG